MAKKKSSWYCTECGHESVNYLGKCPSCKSWNTFKEALPIDDKPSSIELNINSGDEVGEKTAVQTSQHNTAKKLKEIQNSSNSERLNTGFGEFDRVLGGGLQQGSVILLGGDPGIGKSTLILQVMGNLAKNYNTLYVSGEESYEQVKQRANRLEVNQDILFLAETNLENIINNIEEHNPKVLIIDSIQTVASREQDALAGTPTQIRYCSNFLVHIAKKYNITIILIGHITKDGNLAGPKLLEHMVDVVLHFEGDRQNFYRILRGRKNRFGPTDELGIFEMQEQGLEEITNPSELFLTAHNKIPIGSVLTTSLQGSRVMLAEVQALVGYTSYAQPRRVVTGLDYNRMNQVCAILERRIGFNFSKQDIYASVIGGLNINEPAGDLSMALAIISCARDVPPIEQFVALGEIGLSADIRAIPSIELRLKEIYRHGLRNVICPKLSKKIKLPEDMKVHQVSKLQDALKIAFKS